MALSFRQLARAAGFPAMGLVLAACSSDASSIDIIPKPGTLLRPDWTSFSGHKEEFDLRQPGSQDLVSAQGLCPGQDLSPDGSSQALVQGGIALQMTECDVVRRAGFPDRTEVGSD